MKTLAPSAANFWAVARPIPLVPPVTRATLPASFWDDVVEFMVDEFCRLLFRAPHSVRAEDNARARFRLIPCFLLRSYFHAERCLRSVRKVSTGLMVDGIARW